MMAKRILGKRQYCHW